VEEDKDDLEEGAEENGGANQESKNVGAKKYELFDERIVTVTDENLTQYTINDVIMPIPGDNIATYRFTCCLMGYAP
jgi:hypothetical protein